MQIKQLLKNRKGKGAEINCVIRLKSTYCRQSGPKKQPGEVREMTGKEKKYAESYDLKGEMKCTNIMWSNWLGSRRAEKGMCVRVGHKLNITQGLKLFKRG